MRASDLMTRDVATVTPDTPLEELCDLFRQRKITGAPVVDGEGRLVGIVSKDDVIFRRRGDGDRPRQESDIRQLFTSGFVGFNLAAGNGATRVSDIMTREVICAPEDMSVEDLCRLMWEKRVHRIPIVRGAILLGIVSALDICRGVMDGGLRRP
jgi:CBS domain-containing protein